MNEYAKQNKAAWEYSAYDFWVSDSGDPAVRAKHILADPIGALKRYAAYFDSFDGLKVANICGSCGKKAVPLAVLGSEVTVFDISEENKRYALELSEAAGTHIQYEVCDILEIDLTRYAGYFDVVFMEGGVLHYFQTLKPFMDIMHALLVPGGRLICSDFHPYTKISDILKFGQPLQGYFSDDTFEGEMPHARFFDESARCNIPKCRYRKYTISQIINTAINSGFSLERFDEHPAWTDPDLPGEFTLIGRKH